MTEIRAEIVEAGARALCFERKPPCHCERACTMSFETLRLTGFFRNANAALEAAAPLLIAAARERCAKNIAWLDALDGETLIALHDHIHTIMDERAGNKISAARAKKAKGIRSAP
jgi:hypothetical protein